MARSSWPPLHLPLSEANRGLKPLQRGSVIFLIDAEGRVLLQQRDDDVPPAGYGRWAIPGGGREGDESPRETVLREFEEETGVKLERLRHFATYEAQATTDEPARIQDAFYADDAIAEDAIVIREGLAFKYWSPREAADLSMNPRTRARFDAFVASDQYTGTVESKAAYLAGASVIEIDRWGRVLLQLRDADLPEDRYPDQWSIPGGLVRPGEAPDAAAFREFEEETGQMLDDLKLFDVFRRTELETLLVHESHVFYTDADVREEDIVVNEGQAFRYFKPEELEALSMPVHARTILTRFVEGTHYKAMFH